MANLIHSRDDKPFEPRASSKTRCFKCMNAGTRFVFINGSRAFACEEHYRLWRDTALQSPQMRDRVLGTE